MSLEDREGLAFGQKRGETGRYQRSYSGVRDPQTAQRIDAHERGLQRFQDEYVKYQGDAYKQRGVNSLCFERSRYEPRLQYRGYQRDLTQHKRADAMLGTLQQMYRGTYHGRMTGN